MTSYYNSSIQITGSKEMFFLKSTIDDDYSKQIYFYEISSNYLYGKKKKEKKKLTLIENFQIRSYSWFS